MSLAQALGCEVVDVEAACAFMEESGVLDALTPQEEEPDLISELFGVMDD